MIRKLILLFACCWIFPVIAQNLDEAIEKLTTNVPGQVVTPKTTTELAILFKDATDLSVPRIFVDKLPEDFAQKGSPELYMHVITALILRSNELALRDKMLLTALKNKYDKKEPWTTKEESFFHAMVEKYDVTVTKTIDTQLEKLLIKIDEVVPGLAVAQSVYATDWGKKNMMHPYGQMGWLDEQTYAELPYNSLIEATEAYVTEMNREPSYWQWRIKRQKATHNRLNRRLAYILAGNIAVYRLEDPYYAPTVQKIILNNKPLSQLYEATFIEK